MDVVVTLIANPKLKRLDKEFVDAIAAWLVAQGISAPRLQWLEQGIACDLFLTHHDPNIVDALVREKIADEPVDTVVQNVAERQKKLLVADMDSTMITVECIDELADFAGLKSHVAAITERAMNGELDFEAALVERVGLLKGLPESVLQEAYSQRVKIMDGARALVAAMRRAGAYCLLVSGGFSFFTSRVAQDIGFQEDHANRLEIENGLLTGRVIPPILGKEAKLASLEAACEKLGIGLEEALAIGDGANDLPMLKAAGLGVAYHAKPVVLAQSNARIIYCDLSALIWAQGLKFG